MSGITPYRTLHDIARALPTLSTRAEVEAALDEIEFAALNQGRFNQDSEVIPPEMQEYAEPVIAELRVKLASFTS